MREPNFVHSEAAERFFNNVIKLSNADEARAFFEDICTIKELNSLIQRMEVAGLLRGGATFVEIEQKTGASSATIARVNRALNYGASGYDIVL